MRKFLENFLGCSTVVVAIVIVGTVCSWVADFIMSNLVANIIFGTIIFLSFIVFLIIAQGSKGKN